MRLFSGDVAMFATFCILAGWEQEVRAIIKQRNAASCLRAIHRILA